MPMNPFGPKYEEEEDENPIQIVQDPRLLQKMPLSPEIIKALSPIMDVVSGPNAEAATISKPKEQEQVPQPVFNLKKLPDIETFPSYNTNENKFQFKKIDESLSPKKESLSPKKEIKQLEKEHQSTTLPNQNEIKQFIIDEARKRGRDPALVLAHFEKESSFNPAAINKKGGGTGARGLSQIRGPAFQDVQKYDKTGQFQNMTHKEMSDPRNWKKNIQAGLDYYDIIDKYWKPKTEKEFLKNYNQGSIMGKNYNKKAAEKYASDVFARYNRNKQYVDQIDQQRQRELASTNVDSGEEIAADKMDVIKNIKKLMMP